MIFRPRHTAINEETMNTKTENKSDHPTAPLCVCDHEKREHSLGDNKYVEGMPASACYWDDGEELCECRQYRPASSEAKAWKDESTEKNLAAKIHLSDEDAALLEEFRNAVQPATPPTPADGLLEAARKYWDNYLETIGQVTCEEMASFAAERVSAAIDEFIREVELELIDESTPVADGGGIILSEIFKAMRSVAERGFRK
jgi:hypothetical protein